MEMLIDLYNIYNPSGYECNISLYVQNVLRSYGIKFNVDKYNQIYKFNEGQPILSAHMDSVSTKPCKHVIVDEDIIRGTSNIGADDKNGVWIALQLLKKHPELSFIFSTEEETGGKIKELPLEEIKGLPYALIFDRMGSGDIIGTYNDYCCADLEDDISDIGIGYDYTPTMGTFSDCDELRNYIPCVNLSCGYYMAHTDSEFTVIGEIYNSLEFGHALIEGLPKDKKYELPDVISYGHWRRYKYFNSYYDDIPEEWICTCECINDMTDTFCWSCGTLYTDLYGEEEIDEDELCTYCYSLTSDADCCEKCIEATYDYYDLDKSKIENIDWSDDYPTQNKEVN